MSTENGSGTSGGEVDGDHNLGAWGWSVKQKLPQVTLLTNTSQKICKRDSSLFIGWKAYCKACRL